MAYSAPELLLVGAAQNLVLGGSNFDQKNTPACLDGHEQEDGSASYDDIGLW